jgi:sigma-B regulation protein RsbU (phosphoserine phosphatase)
MGRLRNFEVRVFRRLRRDPPQGRIHRLAFWLLVSYVLLALGRILPGGAGTFFRTISALTLFVLIVLCIPLLWRYIFGRLLWRVSNRLVVTYVLMALTPVVLFATLASILLYVFSGQFAIFAATAEINAELDHIASANRAIDLHVSHAVDVNPKAPEIPMPEATADFSADHEHIAIEVAAFADGKPLRLLPESLNSATITRPPGWASGHFNGVVIDNGGLFLRAIDSHKSDGRTVTTITSLPLGKENVGQIARGLGTVTIVPDVDIEEQPDAEANNSGGHTHVYVNPAASGVKVNGHTVTAEEARRRSVRGGSLPEAQHFYDIPVTFYAPLETVDWVTGKPRTTYTHVTSRPSLLYQRLFITSLKIAAVVQDMLIAIAIAFGVLELVAFIMAVRLNRTITQSIRDLYEATTAIDRGDLTHRIKVTRHDQLAALGHSFNSMAASLERLLEEQREKERLQNELEIAQEVQANLFPMSNVSLPMLELHGACYPARTVSGDYYDFLVFGNSGLGLALGDISGKGISAALLMATLHSAVRAYRFAGLELINAGNAALASSLDPRIGEAELECGELFEEPGKILALLNRHLYRSTQPEKYATLFLAHYEGAQRRLVYSTGGQLPPLLLRADDSIIRLDCGGTVVGLIDNMSYEQGTEQLYPGDILIAYSDGVTEPENEFGEFGEERLVEVVRRHRHLPLQAISEQVMQSLRTWIGGQEQPDDITLVLARQL